ncbi:hypothetical protein IRJ41_010726 [Triplophysa rosa]|uniref:Uncharacterized protein n=1 Tax=Triplophysa rosa TaxID=992332 RepID=A0A9W7WZX8_TRIRA|nr:hypothetical protein IRJ41_010726 [Triplophysa rosa]
MLHEHPECLYVDLTSQEKKANLIFYTDRDQRWKNAIINHFPFTKKKGICKGSQICIYESADHTSHYQTINLYNSGTPSSHRTSEAPPSSQRTPEAPPSSRRTPEAPPSSQRTPEAPPSSHRTPEAPPSSHRTPEAPPSSHRTPEAPPSSHRTPEMPEAPVVLLMDSNGTKLVPKKLFPRHGVIALRCRNTERAHELLTGDELGSPQCIIIHTGTNDLHGLNEGTAKAMHDMAKKASQTFPSSRVLISTLLPRLDFPPSVIDKINQEVSRTCSSLPNVHLVHHRSIRPWHLHDGLHLNQDGIRIFAKAIKDVALGRATRSSNTRMQFDPSGPSHTRPSQDRLRRPTTSQWTNKQHDRHPYDEAPSQLPLPERPQRNYGRHLSAEPPLRNYAQHPSAELPQRNYGQHASGEQSQQPLSYAQVLSQKPPVSSSAHELNSNDVGEIKRLLNLLCNKIFN